MEIHLNGKGDLGDSADMVNDGVAKLTSRQIQIQTDTHAAETQATEVQHDADIQYEGDAVEQLIPGSGTESLQGGGAYFGPFETSDDYDMVMSIAFDSNPFLEHLGADSGF